MTKEEYIQELDLRIQVINDWRGEEWRSAISVDAI